MQRKIDVYGERAPYVPMDEAIQIVMSQNCVKLPLHQLPSCYH